MQIIRRHSFPVFVRLGFSFGACLVPLFVWIIFYSKLLSSGFMTLFLFISSIWYMIFWLLIFHSLTTWSLTVVIITDKRIIDNEQHGLFNREISELLMPMIQDVSTHTHGIVETMLKFGDIVVQTAASERQFVFKQIPNPEEVKNIIMRMVSTNHMGNQHADVHNTPK